MSFVGDIEDLGKHAGNQSVYLNEAQFKAELDKCLSCETKPCKTACPCDCSPYDFILAARNGDFDRGFGEIMSANPMGGVCGVICPDTFCMSACVRQGLDEPVNIPAVQAYIVRKARDSKSLPVWRQLSKKSSFSVAVVGAGPAGLSCTAVLSRAGVNVTLYESKSEVKFLAGAVRTIPSSRLPSSMVDEDCAWIVSHPNVTLKMGHTVHDWQSLCTSHNAVCVAPGLQKARKLGIPGEDGLCVEAMDFLWGFNAHLSSSSAGAVSVKGKSVAVVGGGPVAVDVATTCLQRGASQCTLLYRRSQSEMTLTAKERATLKRLGVDVIPRVVPVRIEGHSKDDITRVVVRRAAVTGGRRDLAQTKEVSSDIDFTEFQVVIVACGNEPAQVEERFDNCIYAGDFIRGASTVVEASAFGKAAAGAILSYLEEGNKDALKNFTHRHQSRSDLRVTGFEKEPVSLKTSWFNLELDSPFLLSASPLTDGLNECRRALHAGWAGLVTKTSFCKQYVHVPDRYMVRLGQYTYGNCDNVSAFPLESQCETIKTLRKEFPNKLIAGSTGGTLSGNKESDRASWTKHTHMLEEAGAQVIEYSLSCPQGGEGAEDNAIASQSAQVTAEIIEWVLSGCSKPNVPKVFKLTAAVTSVVQIVSAAKAVMQRYPNCFAGITMANSFPALDSLPASSFHSISPSQSSLYWNRRRVVGMSGEGVLPITRLAISSLKSSHVDISANGGIMTAADAADCIALGCHTIQMCTAPSLFGLHYIEFLRSSLSHLLHRHGLSSVAQLFPLQPSLLVENFMQLSAEKSVPHLDASICVKCGNCSRCPYGAITMGDVEDGGFPVIDASKCVGCGLCTLKCPASGSLTMGPRNKK